MSKATKSEAEDLGRKPMGIYLVKWASLLGPLGYNVLFIEELESDSLLQ